MGHESACSDPSGCPLEAAINVIGGKWKVPILYHLLSDIKRFSELKRLMPAVTQRMLTRQLRELEADQIILRTVYAEVPSKVEYSITEFGLTLAPTLEALRIWGRENYDQLIDIRTGADEAKG